MTVEIMTLLRLSLLWIVAFFNVNRVCEVNTKQIEDYRPGYPRFSALIAAHDSFHICRRFSNLRARLLLLKQDKLSVLEEQLQKVDAEERAVLFLGSSRDDRNGKRHSLLSEIDTAMAEYDDLIGRNHQILDYKIAKPRDVLSLQNWVNGNASLSREETEYLTRCNDLLGVASIEDNAIKMIEAWVENILVRFFKSYQENTRRKVSRDPHVYIFPNSLLKRAARMLILFLITIILSAPVIICNSMSGSIHRVIAIIIFLVVFLAVLSGLTMPRTMELLLAGVTYTTVLIVFITGTTTS